MKRGKILGNSADILTFQADKEDSPHESHATPSKSSAQRLEWVAIAINFACDLADVLTVRIRLNDAVFEIWTWPRDRDVSRVFISME